MLLALLLLLQFDTSLAFDFGITLCVVGLTLALGLLFDLFDLTCALLLVLLRLRLVLALALALLLLLLTRTLRLTLLLLHRALVFALGSCAFDRLQFARRCLIAGRLFARGLVARRLIGVTACTIGLDAATALVVGGRRTIKCRQSRGRCGRFRAVAATTRLGGSARIHSGTLVAHHADLL